jgi:hypothetical protein
MRVHSGVLSMEAHPFSYDLNCKIAFCRKLMEELICPQLTMCRALR